MRTTFLLFLFFLCGTLQSLAQSEGITYQAVILSGPSDITEIPGVDVPGGNYLPDQALELRFTILDQFGTIEYQETQSTSTDRYGMVSVIIGDGTMTSASPNVFAEIDWDGTPKDLRVEVELPPPAGTGAFVEFSLQKLVFVPYAFHRNITATGTMIIDGATTLNNSLLVANGSPTHLTGTLTLDSCLYLQDCLVVHGTTDLNNSLNVNLGTPTNLSGTLNVDSAATLNSSLNVIGTTDLNNGLNVNLGTPTDLSGTLNVDGTATLNSSLDVDGAATLNYTLDVAGATDLNSTLNVAGATDLNSSLDVAGATSLDNTLDVAGPSNLNTTLDVAGFTNLHGTHIHGQTTITAQLSGSDADYNIYPLRVEGGQQGMAIKVSATAMDHTTNFITFFDGNGDAVGRIEGQSHADVVANPQYIYDNAVLLVNVGLAYADLVAAGSATTPCLGLGACATAPPISEIIVAGIKVVAAEAAVYAYNIFAHTNLGVTYESGSADYAEWLERADTAETMSFGDIVAVNGGRISKSADTAERYMVISHKPAVLGNSPEPGKEHLYEKVCFMGQVPVKVIGPVKVGDYILPSGYGNGFGRAVAPGQLTLADHDQIVGRAWSATTNPAGGFVNVAVGMGNNDDLTDRLTEQQSEIDELRAEMKAMRDEMHGISLGSVAQKAPAAPSTPQPPAAPSQTTATAEAMHPPITREMVEESLEQWRVLLRDNGMDPDQQPFLKHLQDDPAAYQAYVDQVMKLAEVERQRMIAIDRQHGY